MQNIIVKKDKNGKGIIYLNKNFNNAVHFIESIALDTLFNYGGSANNFISKRPPINKGYYLLSTRNKYSIYYKEKDGLISYGASTFIVSFELFTHRKNEVYEIKTINRNDYEDEYEEFREKFNGCLNAIRIREIKENKL